MSRAVPMLYLAAHLFSIREEKSLKDSISYLKENSGSRNRWMNVAQRAALLLSDLHSAPVEGSKSVRLAISPNPVEEAPGNEDARVPAFVLYASDDSGLTALEEYILNERSELGRDHPRVVEALAAQQEFSEWQEARRASAAERAKRRDAAEEKTAKAD